MAKVAICQMDARVLIERLGLPENVRVHAIHMSPDTVGQIDVTVEHPDLQKNVQIGEAMPRVIAEFNADGFVRWVNV